ncbi:MAG: DNA recombination protein RmuC, partial [Bacteroidales bacterium]|nr:DNA recombination protein RmuC [Bacteroidales bacterium]
MDLLFLCIGIAIGSITVYFILSARMGKEGAVALERSILLQSESDQLKKQIQEKGNEILNISGQLHAKERELQLLNQRFLEQRKEIEEVRERFNLEFKNLANEILEEKSKKFTEQNKNNLDSILNPLRDKILEFEQKVERTHAENIKGTASLKEQIQSLRELNQQITKETENLTKALKGESKTQGNWGEMILESILERTGLRRNQEYFIQQSYNTSSGKRLQPDVLVNYPGERSIVIDSKVSLTAYERFINAASEEEREKELKAHLVSVKNHITELSGKSYQDLEQIQTLDYVVMFMPVEPAYLIAIQSDPQLWTYAYEKRILLISPTNLIAVL